MKKYIPVFGDQSLFDGAPEDAEYAGWFCQEVRWYMILNGKILFSDGGVWSTSDSPYLSSDIAAMRRIIKEPKHWTWEDKKAGRLPEVGSLIMEVESQYGFEFVGVCAGSKRFAVKDVLDGLIYFYNKDVISPIETPAEKAQRLEDEWVESAFDAVMIVGVHSTEDIQRIKNHLRTIYRAQLSGELQAPKGE